MPDLVNVRPGVRTDTVYGGCGTGCHSGCLQVPRGLMIASDIIFPRYRPSLHRREQSRSNGMHTSPHRVHSIA
ncbi:hypothetical protein LMG24235_03291 [Paraburkholderia sabiae]|nr:hypothetical protein LMG24235_03291 [Paraburkholderia sabiae]